MRRRDGLVGIIPIVMVPIEGQIIPWLDSDSVWCLDIAHDVASHIYRLEVFDRRVRITTCMRSGIVCGRANRPECSLIYTIDENTL